MIEGRIASEGGHCYFGRGRSPMIAAPPPTLSCPTRRQSRSFDLSHVVEDGMITYKGLPAPVICDYLSREQSRSIYAEGTEFHIGKIEMVANTGTYLDSPFHRYADGKDLSELPLSSLAGLDGILVRLSAQAIARSARQPFAGWMCGEGSAR